MSTVYLLHQTPLTNHDLKRIDRATLVNSGLSVRILDATELLLPGYRLQGLDVEDLDGIPVRSPQQLVSVAELMGPEDAVIFLGGFHPGQIEHASSPYRVLAGTPATLGAINVSHQAQHAQTLQDSWPLVRRALRLAGRGPRAVAGAVSARSRRVIDSARMPLRPLDLVWVGTMTHPISPSLIGPNTLVRFLHTYDYEDVRRAQLSLSGHEDNLLVLLHDGGPAHPDFGTQNRNPFSIGADEYDSLLRASLFNVAELTCKEPVVAAHPKTPPGSLDSAFEPIRVVYGGTASLVANAGLILDPAESTALSMAVTARRPIAFLRTVHVERSRRITQARLAESLGVPVLDMDSKIRAFVVPKIDVDRYAEYEASYVKKPGTSDVPFWQQVVDDLRATPSPLQADDGH